jgi:YVTN family beta-propeller protein
VGNQPASLAYDSGKGEVFVANHNSSSVSVISDSTNSIVATVDVGVNPIGLAYDSDNGRVFVANYYSYSVSVISDSTNTVVANVPLESPPQGICYDSGRGKVFVTYSESNRISVISATATPSDPQEPFPTLLVATASGDSAAVVCLGVLVYFKKRKH